MGTRTIGYTTGVYDLFHIGHLNILRNAREHCDHLIVGVTTDELCRALKSRDPVIPFQERFNIIEAIRYVDSVYPQARIDELGDWEQLGFHKIFKGSDWEGSPKWRALEEKFLERDVEVVYLKYTESTSSTFVRNVLEKLQSEELAP